MPSKATAFAVVTSGGTFTVINVYGPGSGGDSWASKASSWADVAMYAAAKSAGGTRLVLILGDFKVWLESLGHPTTKRFVAQTLLRQTKNNQIQTKISLRPWGFTDVYYPSFDANCDGALMTGIPPPPPGEPLQPLRWWYLCPAAQSLISLSFCHPLFQVLAISDNVTLIVEWGSGKHFKKNVFNSKTFRSYCEEYGRA